MDFSQLIRARYSVRAYKPDPVPDELLVQVLEAARLGATAANRQPFQVIVIRTAGREAELRRVYPREWFVQAPLVLCVCAVLGEAWVRGRFDGKNSADVDAAIVMDHMILAAADLGLGTCWVAAFNPGARGRCWGCPKGSNRSLSRPWAIRRINPGPRSASR